MIHKFDGRKRLLIIAFLLAVLLINCPVLAEYYMDPAYLINVTPANLTITVDGSVGINGYFVPGYDPTPGSWLFAMCSPYPSGNIITAPGQPWWPIDSGGITYGTPAGGFSAETKFNPTAAGCYASDLYFNIINYSYSNDWPSQIIASWLNGTLITPVCSFTAIPSSGVSPLPISLVDTSANIPTSWLWLVKNNGTGPIESHGSSLQTFTSVLNNVATFDVTHNATNMAGTCSEFLPNYLTVTAPITSTTIIVNLDVKNAITGNLIYDSQVGIQNTTSGQWRNSTSPTGLVFFDSTGPAHEYPLSLGQIIQESACATGYQCANITFPIPYNNYKSYLNLVPDTVVNTSGTYTLVVTVVMQKSGLPMKGASVLLNGGSMKLTTSAGSATFYNVTAGSTKATASFVGYQTAEKTFTGVAGQTKMISLELVPDGETPAPTLAAPTPTISGTNGTLTGANIKGAALIDEILNVLIDFGAIIVLVLIGWFFVKIGKDIFGL